MRKLLLSLLFILVFGCGARADVSNVAGCGASIPGTVYMGTSVPSSCGTGAPASFSIALASQTLFSVGSYFAFAGALGNSGTGTQGIQVQPATFPNGSQASWNISGGLTTTVKSFLDVAGYGNYLGATIVQTPIIPCQVQNLTSLTASHNLTFSGTNYNVIYDIFLSNDVAGSSNAFEVEVFLHPAAAAITYFNGLTSLATSVTISGIPWDISVDTTTTPHDILFMPHSRADVPSATLDLKAILAELVTLTTITGKEWYTGHGMGPETIQGTGSFTTNSASVAYSPGLPIQANYIGSQNFTNAFWTLNGVTTSATQILDTTFNGAHFVNNTSLVARTAATKTFVYQADVQNVDPANTRQVLLQTFDSSFADAATGYFDPLGLIANFTSTGGIWVNAIIFMAPVPGSPGTRRCLLQFTTDATSTGFQPRVQLENGSGVSSYPGVITAGLNVTNVYLFNVGAGSGGT